MARTGPPIIMVSSSVYGFEQTLDQIDAVLRGFGYRVWMSHNNTLPVNSKFSNFQNCLRAVKKCDSGNYSGTIWQWQNIAHSFDHSSGTAQCDWVEQATLGIREPRRRGCPPVAKAVSVRWSREKKEVKLQADHVSRRYPRDRYVRGSNAAIRSIEATVWKLGSGIPVASRFASANRGSVIESQRNLAKKNFLSEDSYNE